MQKVTCRAPTGNIRLDQAIAQSSEALAHKLSRTLIRKLLVAGAVYVNGKRVRVASRPMRGGETIDIYYDAARAPEKAPADKFLPLRVLYDDDAIICFDKPAGLPTQPTLDEARANLFELAKRQLADKAGKPVYLGMHHRLDRDTSGVVLFTLDNRQNAFIADQFKGHNCTKVYVAVVHGKLKNETGRLESFMGEVGRKGKQAKFGTVRSGGKKAITDFLVLGTDGTHSLIEVRITTGRTHQIRVHFSEIGHPIVGDTLYGSPAVNYGRLGRFLLHAHALTIEHPVTHNSVRIESPLPQEFRL
ncbi:MAG: RluA family pseudouridine synthase [Deltaproteobacteria bacterium]|nr:RluA family pseudouridine synthase [Deltaproteobacteria bacterium]